MATAVPTLVDEEEYWCYLRTHWTHATQTIPKYSGNVIETGYGVTVSGESVTPVWSLFDIHRRSSVDCVDHITKRFLNFIDDINWKHVRWMGDSCRTNGSVLPLAEDSHCRSSLDGVPIISTKLSPKYMWKQVLLENVWRIGDSCRTKDAKISGRRQS